MQCKLLLLIHLCFHVFSGQPPSFKAVSFPSIVSSLSPQTPYPLPGTPYGVTCIFPSLGKFVELVPSYEDPPQLQSSSSVVLLSPIHVQYLTVVLTTLQHLGF
ncbi:hypothetical protein F5Y18DRAFT_399709 [Xylariaceae sp. FL1019]|nr:hypothetical protein F5Y18DRAFT_399709 [Xylariaceae sp. FL1019]